MSTKFYLIRHGQSQGNLKGLFLGHYDLDLTELGYAQAERTANFLQTIKADAIYASDLLRAYHTAETTAKRIGMSIVKDKNLREIFCGDWEAKSFDVLQSQMAGYAVWLKNIGAAHPENGESVLQLQQRVVTALEKIAKDNDGKTVFVFTHATPIRVFAAHCLGKAKDEIKDVPWATNASVTEAVYEDGKFALVQYSRDDFVGELSTAFPANV